MKTSAGDFLRTEGATALREVADVLLVPGLAYVTVLAGIALGTAIYYPSNWIPFMLLGLVTPVLAFLCFRGLHRQPAPSLAAMIAAMSLSVIGLYALARMIKASYQLFGPALHYAVLIPLALLIAGVAVWRARVWQGRSSLRELPRRLGVTAGIACASLAAWCALFLLPNWHQLVLSVTSNTILVSLILCLSWLVASHFAWNGRSGRPIPAGLQVILGYFGLGLLEHRRPLPAGLQLILALAVVAAFILMSFRFDTLFLGSSEAHWEYYVGPIRGIRNGEWLLWDLPSQYGFLNILGAALLPARTAWQSLYVFQGLLLLLAAVMLLRSVGAGRQYNAIAFLLTVSSLYFADPALIGPYLYPSSSVMRFFWCYALVFFFLNVRPGPRVTLRAFAAWGGLIWVAGSLWSAESFIYSSVTFVPALLIAAAQDIRKAARGGYDVRSAVRTAALCAAIPVAMLAAAIGLVSAFYQVRLGHMPDWRVFFEHALSYADGFGSMELHPFGSVWVLLLLFCAALTAAARLAVRDLEDPLLPPLVAALGCLWGVSSYFVGRAVSNNITALLPVLLLITAVTLHASKGAEAGRSNLLIRAVSVPLLTLILMTSLGNPGLVENLRGFKSFAGDLAQRVRPAPPSLQALIIEAGIGPDDPVIYYGSAAAMPRWQREGRSVLDETTWLPNPLQLLEEPVSPERRRTYLARFMSRSSKGGYFIRAKNEPQLEARLQDWSAILDLTHEPVRVYENSEWKIVRYEPRRSTGR